MYNIKQDHSDKFHHVVNREYATGKKNFLQSY